MYPIPSLDALVEELAKLPTIGRRTALRLAYHLSQQPPERSESLEQAVKGIRERLTSCAICYTLTETTPCPICSDTRRERSVICVIEEPADLFSFEDSGSFKGLYHVLGGNLNPMRGVDVDDLRIAELLPRLAGDERLPSHQDELVKVEELILATNPDVDGEATASYIAEEVARTSPDTKITRIGLGLPMGGDLEHADQLTLHKALEGRRAY